MQIHRIKQGKPISEKERVAIVEVKGIKIKPLQWARSGDRRGADGLWVTYEIIKKGEYYDWIPSKYQGQITENEERGNWQTRDFDTLREAKAWCERHWEKLAKGVIEEIAE